MAQWQQTNGPVSAGVVKLASTENALFTLTDNYKVFVSTNNGESWQQTNMTSRWSLTTDYNKVYTSTRNELHISTDNGQTFTSVSAASDYGHVTYEGTIISLAEDFGMATSIDDGETWIKTEIDALYMSGMVKFNNTLIGGTDNGLFKSLDKGFTWENVAFINKQVMSVAEHDNNLYVSIYGEGVQYSSDGGATWQALNEGLSTLRYCKVKQINNALWLTNDYNGIYKLIGSEWKNQTYNLPDGIHITDITFFNNNIFVSSRGNGVFLFSNNAWVQRSIGIESYSEIKTIFSSSNRLFASLREGGLFYSDNHGNNWQWSNLTTSFCSFYTLNNILYAGTSNGLYSSANNGNSWDLLAFEGEYISNIAFNNNVFYCTNINGIFKSTDFGLTWTNFSEGLPKNFDVISIATNKEYIFASSWDHKVYKSSISDAAWTSASNGLNNDLCKAIVTLDTVVFVSDWWNGIYKTSDNGDTWTYSGLDGMCIVEFKQWNEYLFAATWEDGIFYTTDKGKNWTAYSEGLDIPFTSPDNYYHTFESLAIDKKYIYAGGTDTKVWKCLLPGITDTTTTPVFSHSGKETTIHIYPNPAANYITIESNNRVPFNIKIFNSKGQLALAQRSQNKTIDVSALKPGIYFIEIKSNTTITKSKFIKL